ncbi:MAG TPA: thiamine pyrophosphate-binding protein [Rhizomicrobium sp.]|jgi:acetolactate synthase-1/2/3 large subunit|nr:thiamine pyrophosphate-binding protein [Rhizomicrobium sp.]
MARTGGQALVEALTVHGATHAFCVPGESYLFALDALYDAPIKLVTCRQEGGAANMAEAFGKLTGKPGICFVTRGPGATNASIGVHTAFQDSTPMILFIGQADQSMLDREAFQEVDFRAMFSPLCKWAAEIRDPNRIPEYIARAFHVAVSGRPGPVVLSLPEDVLSGVCDAADTRPYKRSEPSPSQDEMADFAAMLEHAERPVLMLGGPGWDHHAITNAKTFAERWHLPVCTSFRAKDRFDNTHPLYVGDFGIGADPALVKRVKDCDLLIVVGARLGEMTTDGYTRIDAPVPKQTLVHVHPSADELNRVYQADRAIVSGVAPFLRAAASLPAPDHHRWRMWADEGRTAYEAWTKPVIPPGKVNPSEIFAWLDRNVPADAIFTNGAGNYAGWLHRFHLHRAFPTQLAPTSGAMGYGVPAAIAAKIVEPERMVIASAGDGCFLMNGQELATAVQYNAAIIVLVFDNGTYGTIRMHQEREFPGRVIGTDLHNPDFAALAESYGALGLRVNTTEEFAVAFEKAVQANKPALIHIKTDAEAISPTTTITKLREAKK